MYKIVISIGLVLLPTLGISLFLPQGVRGLWTGGVLLGMFTMILWEYLFNEKGLGLSISCAPTAKTFHTFSSESQWSCDCGAVRSNKSLNKQ